MLLILALVVIVLFIIGVVFIFRGYQGTPDAALTVSTDELKTVENELKAAHEHEGTLKQQLDALTLELDSAKGSLEEKEQLEEKILSLRSQEDENNQKIESLQKKINFISHKADTQAQDAIEVINTLSEENASLKKEVGEVANRIEADVLQKLTAEKSELQSQLNENLQKIDQLEQKLDNGQQKSDESDAAQSQAAQLSEENQKLKEGVALITQKIQEVESEVQKLKQEDLNQLNAATTEIARLQNEINQLNSQITDNTDTVKQLEEQSVSNPGSQIAKEKWMEEKVLLEKNIRKLKDLNEHLSEKEKILQSELTKSRAKAIALEKACEGL